MFWNPDIETAERAAMEELQSKRLREAVRRAWNVPAYRKKMEAADLTPGDIQTVGDLTKLPFNDKTDFRDNYPYGMLALPLEDLIRVHASSGTTGKPTVAGYTRHDIEVWNECMARCLTGAGLGKGDVIHVAYGYGMFTGGLGGHYGAETIGATTLPVSTGNTKRQLMFMSDLGSTALLCTPSYAMLLGDAVRAENIPIHLKVGVFGAEAWSEEMRAAIEERLGISAYDIYGLSEISGPGVSCECACKNGLHVQEDHFIPEIVDPATGEVLPDGQTGELVFSCVTKEALPLLRYRTRDITSLTREPCACGRTTVRMHKPSGRTDDMLIIRGVNVFPSQIESVLLSFGTLPHYQIIVDRQRYLDTMEILVEMSDEWFTDEVRGLEALERKLQKEIEDTLNIGAKVTMVSPNSIPRSEGKAVRVVDKRKI